jgi:acyl-coenzyme A thioesterase PaaI-like protein
MTSPSREEKLDAWLAADPAMRATLGAPGSMSLGQVSELQPQEFFDRIGSGELPSPPFGHLLDFIPLEWAPGRFVFQGTPDARHYNPLGSVHGGKAASLLDSCMGCAIHTQLQRGRATPPLIYASVTSAPSTARTDRSAPKAASFISAAPPPWPKDASTMSMTACMRLARPPA